MAPSSTASAAGGERRRRQWIATGIDRRAAEGQLGELEVVTEARADRTQAREARGDDLGPDAVTGQYRDARLHARRSKAWISLARDSR
jgi:hypothetical protein